MSEIAGLVLRDLAGGPLLTGTGRGDCSGFPDDRLTHMIFRAAAASRSPHWWAASRRAGSPMTCTPRAEGNPFFTEQLVAAALAGSAGAALLPGTPSTA